MRIDVIKNFVHLRVREPSEFNQNTFRIKQLGTHGRMHIVVGKLKNGGWEAQAYRWRIKGDGGPGFTLGTAMFLAQQQMKKLSRKNYYCWRCRRRHYQGNKAGTGKIYSMHKQFYRGMSP